MWQNFLIFLSSNRWPISFLCMLGFLLMMVFLISKSFNPEFKIKKMQQMGTFFRIKKKFRDLCAKFMQATEHMPVIGDTAANMKYSFVCQYATTDENARYLTGRCFVVCISVFAVSMIGAMIYFSDVVLSLIVSVMLMRVAYQGLRGDSLKFLDAVEDSIDDFVHAYHANNENLDIAFQKVINSGSPVAGHWGIMRDYIQQAYCSSEPEIVQKAYYAIAPARIFRNLYTCIYMTYKYGDSKDSSGTSAFTENIYRIEQELIEKINSIRKLRTGLFGERWFIILPVFALPLLSTYMVKYFSFEGFELIEEFVNSPLGYTVQIICAALSLFCYFIYEKMVDDMVLEPKHVCSWESKLLFNHRIALFVQKVMPTGSVKRKRLQTVLMRSGSTESVDAFTIRRYASMVGVCIVCVISLVLNNATTIYSIQNNIYQGLARESYQEVLLSQNDTDVFIQEQLDADKRVLEHIKTVDGWYGKTEEDQREYLSSYIRNDFGYDYRGYYDDAITRLISKANLISKSGSMMNVIFVLLFTAGTFVAPLVMVYVQAFLNKDTLISDETADLQATALMLLSHKSTTPQTIVRWFAHSSVLLSEPCYKAAVYNDFTDMKEATTYKPLRQLGECAEYACSGMDMDEAFADLKQKMLVQQKERIRESDADVQNRIDRVEMCSTISLGAAMALYMFVPILVAMIDLFMSFSTMM